MNGELIHQELIVFLWFDSNKVWSEMMTKGYKDAHSLIKSKNEEFMKV